MKFVRMAWVLGGLASLGMGMTVEACASSTPAGTLGDAGAPGDTGTTKMDGASKGDTGTGIPNDTGTGTGDTGHGGDTGSGNADTGSSNDSGSGGDTGSGARLGGGSDTGTGDAACSEPPHAFARPCRGVYCPHSSSAAPLDLHSRPALRCEPASGTATCRRRVERATGDTDELRRPVDCAGSRAWPLAAARGRSSQAICGATPAFSSYRAQGDDLSEFVRTRALSSVRGLGLSFWRGPRRDRTQGGGSATAGGGAGDAGSGDTGAGDAGCHKPPHALYKETVAGVYCPFSSGGAAHNLTCTSGQHCCEPSSGTATCSEWSSARADRRHRLKCDGPVDCAGSSSGHVCCGTGTIETQPICGTYPAYPYVSHFKGTSCQSSCGSTFTVCSQDSDCPSGADPASRSNPRGAGSATAPAAARATPVAMPGVATRARATPAAVTRQWRTGRGRHPQHVDGSGDIGAAAPAGSG